MKQKCASTERIEHRSRQKMKKGRGKSTGLFDLFSLAKTKATPGRYYRTETRLEASPWNLSLQYLSSS